MALDFSNCRLLPFQHQKEDVEWLIDHPCAFIASEMRTGKTKIVIDAAQFLFETNKIDRVIVVAPAPVRHVWSHKEMGELAKHLWTNVHATVTDYHSTTKTWVYGPREHKRSLDWYVTNFEFLRSRNRLLQLFPVCGPRTWLVLDESSFVKNHAAEQTKACVQLRRLCHRVTLLNGTPLFHSPLDLFSQGNLISKKILDCEYVSHFKARYALLKPVLTFEGKVLLNQWGRPVQTIDHWVNLEDLEQRFKPYTVRRLQAECLDLPPKLDPVTLTAVIDPPNWKLYKQMRDELVVWLKSGQVVVATTAAVKVLRLSQITGGFLGAPEDAGVGDTAALEPGLLESLDLGGFHGGDQNGDSRTAADRPEGFSSLRECDDENSRMFEAGATSGGATSVSKDLRSGITSLECGIYEQVEIGREKLDVLLWFIKRRLEEDPNLHLVSWSRFRAEALRAEAEVRQQFPQFETALIIGAQKKSDRIRALSLLHPDTSPQGPVFVAGIEGTGSFGLNMTAAHTCVTLSSGYSPGRVAQTLDRLYGPGQTHPIAYFNIMAVGPQGQKTIDFDILAARTSGEDIAQRTASAWVKVLTDE